MAAHLLAGGGVLAAGAVQLIPAVRRHTPTLYRWSGRVFLAGGVTAAMRALMLQWGHARVCDLTQHVAVSVNAVLLAVCAAMAWHTARRREFGEHRVWALRTLVTGASTLFFCSVSGAVVDGCSATGRLHRPGHQRAVAGGAAFTRCAGGPLCVDTKDGAGAHP